jgi:hypothetical protein
MLIGGNALSLPVYYCFADGYGVRYRQKTPFTVCGHILSILIACRIKFQAMNFIIVNTEPVNKYKKGSLESICF